MSRPRDAQRRAVYRWESAFAWAGPRLSLPECAALIERGWRAAGYLWRPPLVHDGRGRRSASGSLTQIKLPRAMRHRAIVLHELAHAITANRWGVSRRAAHGPEFLGVYLWLLSSLLDYDHDTLWRSAVHAGLAVTLFRPRPH